MKHVALTVPEIGLIAGTRAAGGAGLALLLSHRLNADQRRAVGWTLLAVGIASTIPLLAQVFGKHCASASPEDNPEGVGQADPDRPRHAVETL